MSSIRYPIKSNARAHVLDWRADRRRSGRRRRRSAPGARASARNVKKCAADAPTRSCLSAIPPTRAAVPRPTPVRLRTSTNTMDVARRRRRGRSRRRDSGSSARRAVSRARPGTPPRSPPLAVPSPAARPPARRPYVGARAVSTLRGSGPCATTPPVAITRDDVRPGRRARAAQTQTRGRSAHSGPRQDPRRLRRSSGTRHDGGAPARALASLRPPYARRVTNRPRDDLLANASAPEGRFFRVPKIIE
jgi:hypothetical protein